MTAFRHTTVSIAPPTPSHVTITTRSFHAFANAGIRSAGRSRHEIHAHTAGFDVPRGTHSSSCGPYALEGSVMGGSDASEIFLSLRAS